MALGRGSARTIRQLALPFVVLAMTAVAPDPARASHSLFSHAVERFELSGSAIPGFVDEFDDGSLAPDWNPGAGTTTETGGALTLQDPGTHVLTILPSGSSFVGDTSNVNCIGCPAVGDGLGDFTATATWKSSVIPLDEFFVANLVYDDAGAQHALAIVFANISPLLAEFFVGNIGPIAGFFRVEIDFDPGTNTLSVLNFEEAYVPVLPVPPGDVVMRIHYDDTAREFSAEYSQDGGTSYTAFPNTITPAPGWTGIRFQLQADPRSPTAQVPALHPGAMLLGFAAVAGIAFAAIRSRRSSRTSGPTQAL